MANRSSDRHPLRGSSLRVAASAALLAAAVSLGAAAPLPQDPAKSAAQRASERMRALQREADSLASQERTLLVELRKLEIERQIKTEEVARAGAALKETRAQLGATVARAAALSKAVESERPEIDRKGVV